MKNEFVMPILVLTLICVVVSGALAFMDGITHPVIEAAAIDRAQAAMNAIIPEATGFEQIGTDGLPPTVREAYKTENNVGYIFILSVNGFSGEIRVICGIDPEGEIISCGALSHTETKGIGTILDQPSFTGQFDGKDSRLEGISTVTGATISTRAYIGAIRDAFAAYEAVQGVR